MTLMVLFLQIFILDELSIALWLRPMIFPIVVMLLPMEWRTIWVMLATLAVGLVMDLAQGGAGLYTATLLPLSVLRSWVLYITTRRGVEHGDQTSLFSRMSMRNIMTYVGAMLVLHHATCSPFSNSITISPASISPTSCVVIIIVTCSFLDIS